MAMGLSKRSRTGIKKLVISMVGAVLLALGSGLGRAAPVSPAAITSIVWKGHTWKVTNGGMAGVSPGSGSNVFIDKKGYLHLRITHHGDTWTAAELFTTDKLGFGTYQWQIEGAVDSMDKTTVLGLFPYGPAGGIGGDGENELDTEFSHWNNPNGPNADFTYYPPTGYGKKDASGTSIASDEDDFSIHLTGKKLVTARTVWSSTRVVGTVMLGLQPLSASSNVLHTHTYAPADPTSHIPQTPMPLGINFWNFREHPAHDQEVVIRDFRFVPEKS